MNLIILYPRDFDDTASARLTDHRFTHIRDVLRAEEGDRIRVGLINGPTGQATIGALNQQEVLLTVDFCDQPPPPLPITLLCALPRPKTLKKLLQASVAMGVKNIFLFRSQRVDKSYWQSPLLSEQNLRQQSILGLEQARDTVVPVIEKRALFKPFVQDELPHIIQGTTALLAHPGNTVTPPKKPAPYTLAIGPEGGFIPYEVELFKSIGFEEISLGQRPLRVEHAAVALLARLF